MDRNRGILVVAGSFALLAAGVAVTLLVRKQRIVSGQEHMEEIEEMIEDYEEYKAALPQPKAKAKRSKSTPVKNGHVSHAKG